MFLRDPKTKAVKWIAKEHHDKLMKEQAQKAKLHKAEAERAQRALRACTVSPFCCIMDSQPSRGGSLMVEQSRLNPSEGGGSNPAPPLQLPELYLEFCSSGDPRYKQIREHHYVPVKGAHAQQVHFLVWYKGEIAGIISGGSAVYGVKARDSFFGLTKSTKESGGVINGVVDNTLFRLVNNEKNLGTRILSLWERTTATVWKDIYGIDVFGFETFIVREGLLKEVVNPTESSHGHEVIIVADPEGHVRRGNLYKAANWSYLGETAGSTKGHDGVGLTGGITHAGVFLRKKTPPKDLYCKWAKGHTAAIEVAYESSWKAGAKHKGYDPDCDCGAASHSLGEEIGTPEQQAAWKATAKKKSLKRKFYLGKIFYRKGKQIICEKLQQAP